MPDHLHILICTNDPDRARWNLGIELRAWTRRFHPGSNIWSPIPKAHRIPDLLHLKRQIRYVHLNPCRAGFVSDPFQWEWSSHRDVTGCVASVWPNLKLMTQVFGVSLPRLGAVMHRYISGDPTVAIGGTPMVRVHRMGTPISADISSILHAAAVVRREKVVIQRGMLRDLVVRTTHDLRLMPESKKLNMSKQSWNRACGRQIDEKVIQAVITVLGDPRCNASPATKNTHIGRMGDC